MAAYQIRKSGTLEWDENTFGDMSNVEDIIPSYFFLRPPLTK